MRAAEMHNAGNFAGVYRPTQLLSVTKTELFAYSIRAAGKNEEEFVSVLLRVYLVVCVCVWFFFIVQYRFVTEID